MTEVVISELRVEERAKAVQLFERLTDVGVPCKLDARASISSDNGLVFSVVVSQAGTDIDEAMAQAPSDDFRCVMGHTGIEFHVIPEDA